MISRVIQRLTNRKVRCPAVVTSDCDPTDCLMENAELVQTLMVEMCQVIEPYLRQIGMIDSGAQSLVHQELQQFWEVYRRRPIRQNSGGSGFHNCCWIWMITRMLQPELIVESGVKRGLTSWLFRQAAPEARILGFDLDLSELEIDEQVGIDFYQQDWNTWSPPQSFPSRSLIFFDCHVNHAQRIHEASVRGFQHVLFDDNPPAHKLYAYGKPPLPTAQMIWDFPQNGLASNELQWIWRGQPLTYTFDVEQISQARQALVSHQVCPDLGTLSRFGGFSFLTYATLQTRSPQECEAC